LPKTVLASRLGVRSVSEGVTIPEFFTIDAVATFHFAVLLRPPRLDVAVAHPGRFNRQPKGERKF